MHPVGRCDLAGDHSRVVARSDPLGDRPQGVPGLDDHYLLCGGRRRFPPSDGARRQRAHEDRDQRRGDHGEGSAPTNVRSLHIGMVGERLFGVKGLLEHMFALPQNGCYLAAHGFQP